MSPSAGPEPGEDSDPEVLVIGSGPNGLVAASILARAGLSVLVLESNPVRPGGAVGSEAATLPGFVHDVGAAFFPWGVLSPAFRELSLARYGLTWEYAPIQSAHPAPDGSCASITRSTDTDEAATFGHRDDTESWRRLAAWYAGIEPHLLPLLLRSFPHLAPLLRIRPADWSRLANVILSSGRGFARPRGHS